MSPRERFAEKIHEKRELFNELCVELVKINSENPPGDTHVIAAATERILAAIPGMHVEKVVAKEPIANIVARLGFGVPGKRLILNGHLDTFPVGDPKKWTRGPLSGAMSEGRIYGRGVSDMKAGLAAALVTAMLLAEERENLRGELVLTLVGDEETGGKWGTTYLLENIPAARGDAMISGDAGSPQVIRFGEKGQLWLEVSARGISNHGAHVHLGQSATDSLLDALQKIAQLRKKSVSVPTDLQNAMTQARQVSEEISGAGEFETLRNITVNIGVIEGGSSINIIPDSARALVDIRLPVGMTIEEVLATLREMLKDDPNVSFEVLTYCDPNVTDPSHEIVTLALKNARQLLGHERVVSNMRVGMSDARLYRRHGVPSIVYGPTPHNMGGADEYVVADEIFSVLYVHAMTAYDYLSAA
jgi:acetylornithine deacetylase/succinyl-diaminopimelate desuccinylase-like protein